MTWQYLSFASEAGFLGGAVVQGDDAIAAVKEAHRLGCNPGGEVLCAPVPEGLMPKESHRNRLLQKDEIDECWDDCDTIGGFREKEPELVLVVPDDAVLCPHQNATLTGSVSDG